MADSVTSGFARDWDDASLGATLLATEDEAEATKIAGVLDKLNKERKSLETQMLEYGAATL